MTQFCDNKIGVEIVIINFRFSSRRNHFESQDPSLLSPQNRKFYYPKLFDSVPFTAAYIDSRLGGEAAKSQSEQ